MPMAEVLEGTRSANPFCAPGRIARRTTVIWIGSHRSTRMTGFNEHDRRWRNDGH